MKKILLLLFVVTIPFQAQSGLLDALGLDKDSPPDVDEAFVLSAQVKDAGSLMARWQIADGNYLYRDKIAFELVGSKNVRLLPFSLPEGKSKQDAFFGLSQVYYQDVDVLLPVQSTGEEQEIVLRVHYQGCSATFNVCYPPVERDLRLLLPYASIAQPNGLPTDNKRLATLHAQDETVSQQDRLVQKLKQGNTLIALISFFALGLLLSLTPCTFPLLPVLSAIIAGKDDKISHKRAFILSLVYVLAMAVTYSIVGVITGLLGESIQALLQNNWLTAFFSALIVVLALAMFGLFDVKLPQRMQQPLYRFGHGRQGGRIINAGLMGALSILIIGPCLTPPLAGALIFISNQGDPFLGGAALFMLSIGMGLPLLIIGTYFGGLLPRAGNWMNAVKASIGVLMLALAIWMLARIVPGWITLLLWGALCVVTPIYMGTFNALTIGASGWHKLRKGLGLLLFVYGISLVVGGLSGSNNVWQPLATITAGSTKPAKAVPFVKIDSLAELQQKLSQSDSMTIVDLYADWCVECKIMAATTFRDSDVVDALATVNTLKLDMTDNNKHHKALLKHFGLFGPPTLLFFDRDGNEYLSHRWIGTISASSLLKHLASLPDKAKLSQYVTKN